MLYRYNHQNYTVIQIPVLKDNYVYIFFDERTRHAVVIDSPPNAKPIIDALEEYDLSLVAMLNTHHHWDHIGANKELFSIYEMDVFGCGDDAARIPHIKHHLNGGDAIDIIGTQASVMFLPGHTSGHIVYYFESLGVLFCGDVIFGMGCGRVMEGTHQQAYDSLQKIGSLPDDTVIYCAHEYTQANGEFLLTVEPNNVAIGNRLEKVRQMRQQNLPTIPTTVKLEKETNLFLNAPTVNDFSSIRKLKDDA